jgi:large subunit ribosomal protein L27
MSKTKQGGSSRLGRDSQSKRLGVKVNAGQDVKIGMIIIRQRGTRYLLGKNVKKGSDDTIYAMKNGVVKFSTKSKKLFNGTRREAKVVSVVPVETTKVAKTKTTKAK